MTLATLALLASAVIQTPAAGVKCVLILPPGQNPTPGIEEKLDTVLKDVQWWYSCQMEGHGYGGKTFSLELDEKGKVVVHIARMPDSATPTTDAEGHRSAAIIEAEKVVGNPAARKGTVMVLAYDGYYWTDRDKYQMKPMGWGLNGRWAHLTGWHIYGINPKAFSEPTPIPSLPESNPHLSPLATKTFQAFNGDGSRTVGERASCSHGTFIHEMGHSFGLHHPEPGDPKWIGDMMTGDGFWNTRGNFVSSRSDWCSLTPPQAAILNNNPLLQVRTVGPPSTGASRAVGMRGAVETSIVPKNCAQVEVSGTGFTVEVFGKGRASHSNRDYVWRNLPASLEGLRFTRLAGGGSARLSVVAQTAGRVYVACAEIGSETLRNAGWQLISPTISYASKDGKRDFHMALYYRNFRRGESAEIPQREWAGTIVIAPGR